MQPDDLTVLLALETSGTLLAVGRAARKFVLHGLLQLVDQLGRARRFVFTVRERRTLEDLDIELWWRTTGRAAA